MTLKTIMKLGIRIFAIITFYNGFISGVRLLSFLFLSQEAREMHLEAVYIGLGQAALGLVSGFVLFRFADRLTAVFGKDYDFGQKLEVIHPNSMVAAIHKYSIIGDIARVVIGVVLIRFRDRLPPLNQGMPAGSAP